MTLTGSRRLVMSVLAAGALLASGCGPAAGPTVVVGEPSAQQSSHDPSVDSSESPAAEPVADTAVAAPAGRWWCPQAGHDTAAVYSLNDEDDQPVTPTLLAAHRSTAAAVLRWQTQPEDQPGGSAWTPAPQERVEAWNPADPVIVCFFEGAFNLPAPDGEHHRFLTVIVTRDGDAEMYQAFLDRPDAARVAPAAAEALSARPDGW